MKLSIDFRLNELNMELEVLEQYLDLIEELFERSKEEAKGKLQAIEYRDDRVEWDILQQELNLHIEVVLPGIRRGPFLITLFTVYETAVTEVAGKIQKRRSISISLDNIKGGLLDRSKTYYEGVLRFKLSSNNKNWERLRVLSNLRNVLAHTNGRLDMVSKKKRDQIRNVVGVDEWYGLVVVEESFLRETFVLVKSELEDLAARYKEWDTANKAGLQF